MESKEFWVIVTVVLIIVCLGSLIANHSQREKIYALEYEIETHGIPYCEYIEQVNSELVLDLHAKNSLLINGCRHGIEYMCGLGE